MTCLIAPYSYWFKEQVINLKDILASEEWDTLIMHVALDIEAYQNLEDKLDRVKHHRIK